MPDRDDTANEPLRGPDILGIVLGLIVIAGLVLGFIVSAGHSYDALTSPDSDDAGPAPVLGQWAMVPPPPGVLPPPPGAYNNPADVLQGELDQIRSLIQAAKDEGRINPGLADSLLLRSP